MSQRHYNAALQPKTSVNEDNACPWAFDNTGVWPSAGRHGVLPLCRGGEADQSRSNPACEHRPIAWGDKGGALIREEANGPGDVTNLRSITGEHPSGRHLC